jgi:hypothetical protein
VKRISEWRRRERRMQERIRNYVMHLLESQGWRVREEPTYSAVDLIATRPNGDKRAFFVKPHGHISRATMATLHKYSELNEISIVHVHEGSGHEVLFSRLYKHLLTVQKGERRQKIK